MLRATKISRRAIHAGLNEIESSDNPTNRIRAVGGGRKQSIEKDPDLIANLELLVEPLTCGDPMSSIRWTCKSTTLLSKELVRLGHHACPRLVASLLRKMKYSLQGNQKTLAGKQPPDRNAQFEYINMQATKQMRSHNPVMTLPVSRWHPFVVGGHPVVVSCIPKQKNFLSPQMPEEVMEHDFAYGNGSCSAWRMKLRCLLW
ncbi:MAG: hypothetical protein A2504_12135 [Bdellovibrionales bacterium RIFOXYD12_FULL_39_22]|nr:MAG: hypothetical protein A2385_00240 [Bdellovibrionales bacterium RIFOXYB1_FULL_39_21]OFZ43281.1 MAG: hypothetical protein A2485_00020 [Bdellovibrionales bacterium RIFOXYC12_FULL_39_17]OFZ46893.1 MAG: hypothetical protein A2404_02185 [Bdellovibrionales bacterium RIFOXYC1_FULL_39_130]OFZ75278.1 MAG: hypothetical protein A2560_14930 [Bdellovibrionales bacterium RIFOXYD1_FULL_39_84]OFZ75899.1 MAG: hypothetical protein A2451_00490 [Bdellovibrionales bacterium RIFOXYC2_FULL_39_8]OFZ94958.1 MAG: